MIRKSRRHGIMVLAVIFSLSAVFLLWHGCGGGGGGSDSGTTPPPTKSVVITGTVPGTVAIAYDKATGKEAARNVASGTPKTFSLNVAPGDYYLLFIENEDTANQTIYSFQNITGGNVFTCKANTTLDLGVIVFDPVTKIAKPQINPISGNDNVTETVTPEANFSPGAGVWTTTRKFVNSTCSGHSPGTTVTDYVTITQGFGILTLTPAGTNETAIGVANVNTAILTEYWQSAPYSALVTIDLTMQSDGSLAGTYSKVGYGGECSEDGTITAVLSTFVPTQVDGKWQFTVTANSKSCDPTISPPEVSVATIVQNGNVLTVVEDPGMSGTIDGNAVHISGTTTSGPHPANFTMDLTIQPGGLEMTGTYLTVELDTQCQIAGDVVAVRIP